MRSSTGALADAFAHTALAAYRSSGLVLGPLAAPLLAWRASRGKENRSRLGERYGRPTIPRPEGRLVWIHAASVGETNAALPLIVRLTALGRPVLLTTTTVTSAGIAAARLPPGAVHQFVPLDVAPFVHRFLAFWQPELAIFVESELWPTTLERLARAGIPLVLANGRMSDRSFRKWRRFAAVSRSLFGAIDLCLARSETDGERFAELGAPRVSVTGNLKFDVPPLAADMAELEHLKKRVGNRPVWLAASTHDGEEEVAMTAHSSLAEQRPGLLSIIVPRHPERGGAIADRLAAAGLAVARRSLNQDPGPGTAVYVADTLGELGLFYRLAPVAFLGGSLVPRGGQNPIEPARLGAVVLHGPHVHNFADIYAALDREGIAEPVSDADALAAALGRLIGPVEEADARASRANAALAPFCGALDATLAALGPYLYGPR